MCDNYSFERTFQIIFFCICSPLLVCFAQSNSCLTSIICNAKFTWFFICQMRAGVYTLCDGPALSHGPYLGTVTICSLVSILLLSIKTCVFSVNSQLESKTSTSLSRKRLHLKKSWGMPVLFLSSVVFALGHIVVAYRTSCKARRKHMFHRVDPEAVSS